MSRKAFTLVELLVVIAIIGMLVSLLLPAVQQARETARVMTCNNHLKQMALACLNYESQHKTFPSAGWVYFFSGDADRGIGKKQPGGWTFLILPFLEQNPLYMRTSNNDPDVPYRDGITEVARTPLPFFYCPSRRECRLYPTTCPCFENTNFASGSTVELAKGDYAANFGSLPSFTYGTFNELYEGYPSTYAGGDSYIKNKNWPADRANGVIFAWSEVPLGMISDGTSNTFLIGERYVNPDYYEISGNGWDDNGIYSGYDIDHSRGTGAIGSSPLMPQQDRPGVDPNNNFGSVHSGSFGMSMCDGSVHRIDYSVDQATLTGLGSRCDGNSARLPE